MAAKSKSRGRSRREKYSPDGNELLVMELQQISSAESQLGRVLPRLAGAAESQELRQMIEQRQQEGERILQELESAFDELEESPGRQRNVAAEGLINDVREHTQEIEEGPALDAVMLAGLQKTEHYCIAAWGTAKSLAEASGRKSAARAMDRALKEGKNYDEQLTQLAESKITPALLSDDEDDSDDSDGGDGNGGGKRRSGGREQRTST